MASTREWTTVAAMVAVMGGGMLAAGPAAAQVAWTRGDQAWCDRGRSDREQKRFCEVLSASVASVGHLEIDGGMNGGVDVVAGRGDGVEVQARVFARAASAERAEQIAGQVEVGIDGGRLWAEGPDTGRRESWGVSYRVTVPAETDLNIETSNGGISVEDVEGDIRFEAMNGGVHLTGVAGDVRGRTTNGGLHIELDGDRWQGRGLDAETTNGGVELSLPEGYSAELETGTVNGGIDIDFPVTVRGRIGRRLRTTLGDGGPPVRVVTTNGGVRITSR